MTREKAIKIIKEFINGTCLHLVDQEALETLIPELKESEDERIRKEIIDFIQWSVDRHFMREDFHQAKRPAVWIAYLEKQKEPGIKWLKSDSVKNPDKPYIDKTGMFYTTDGRMCYASEIEKQKEQKQVDYEVELKKCKDNPLYFYDKYVSIKQKLAEWSEEDERMLSRCIKSVECSKQFADSETYKAAKDVEMNWLKSLPERFNPQPKQEWSEEDEKMRNLAIEWAETMSGQFSFVDMDPTDFRKIATWLKSLKPSWKPSEEQMDRLFSIVAALRKDYCDDMADFLASLYKQLKKL